MNVALLRPMTRDAFFAWAERQERRYEFDGQQPVGMTGGTFGHNQICQNLWAALRGRLRGGKCIPAGPDAGVGTSGNAVRYPDALVTCTKVAHDARLVPSPTVVFEVISPTSGHNDRIVKLREYASVPSILRYVILELDTIGLVSYVRDHGGAPWTVTALTAGETLSMPEIGADIPVAELYEGVELPAAPADDQ